MSQTTDGILFLPDETHPRKMKPIAKRKWDDLEDAIVEFYQTSRPTSSIIVSPGIQTSRNAMNWRKP